MAAIAYTGVVTSALAVVGESLALSYVPVEVSHHTHHPYGMTRELCDDG